ncbi:hypothetical protein NGUA21_01927 [Salmonella enterica]|nr:hypothetical protein NGUA21_01927 [Salmonella enterica]
MDFFVATVDQPCGEIDRHAGKADDRIGARAGGVPSQRDAQTRLQLANAEWLAQVIISSGVKRGNLIAFFAAGGKDNHRYCAPLTQVTNKIDSVAIRQAEIENNQIGLSRGGFQ